MFVSCVEATADCKSSRLELSLQEIRLCARNLISIFMTALILLLECISFSADENDWTEKAKPPMKQQFVITHTIRQIEIAALLES